MVCFSLTAILRLHLELSAYYNVRWIGQGLASLASSRSQSKQTSI